MPDHSLGTGHAGQDGVGEEHDSGHGVAVSRVSPHSHAVNLRCLLWARLSHLQGLAHKTLVFYLAQVVNNYCTYIICSQTKTATSNVTLALFICSCNVSMARFHVVLYVLNVFNVV